LPGAQRVSLGGSFGEFVFGDSGSQVQVTTTPIPAAFPLL